MSINSLEKGRSRERSPAENQLDLVEGIRLRDEGIAQAELSRSELLQIARSIARSLGKKNGTVTADDVRAEMSEQGFSMDDLGPAAGGLFKTGEWVFTGRRIRSAYIPNHAREVKVWEYAG